jgi:transposase
MDNLPAYKVDGVREAIESVGAMLRYRPPSSPDLNPIEMAYGAFKAFLRKYAERTEEAADRTIRAKTRSYSLSNLFAHAG